jgi:hypothetical protein
MRAKLYFISVFIFILGALSAWVYYHLQIKEYIGNVARLKAQNKALLDLNLLQVKYASVVFAENNLKDNQLTTLLDTSAVSNAVIFRFTSLNCSNCIEEELPRLKEFSKRFGDKNIVLLLSYPSSREAQIVVDKYDLHYSFFNVNINSLAYLPIEGSNMPYYYVVKDKQLKMFFIPDKNFPELTKAYLDEVQLLLRD